MTKSVSQSEIVTFAVHLLGGATKFIDTEDVAVKVHQIAPGRFAWRKYSDQINLELVRVYLSDAKKVGKGSYLSGSGRKGWSLTAKGRTWIENNIDLLERNLSLPDSSNRAGSVDVVRANREAQRMKSTEAWRNWQGEGKAISLAQAKKVFRVDSYTKPDMLELKTDRLLNLLADNKPVSEFLTRMSEIIKQREEK